MTGAIPQVKLVEFQRRATGNTKAVAKKEARHAGPKPIFFQMQPLGSATCGLHALNNAIGEDIFSANDLLFALDNFLAENADLGDERGDHVQD